MVRQKSFRVYQEIPLYNGKINSISGWAEERKAIFAPEIRPPLLDRLVVVVVRVSPPSAVYFFRASPPFFVAFGTEQNTGTQFNRKLFGLNFGLKNGLRFHFDYKTCLNYPIFEHFISVGNLKPKLKPKFFSIELGPRPLRPHLHRGISQSHRRRVRRRRMQYTAWLTHVRILNLSLFILIRVIKI